MSIDLRVKHDLESRRRAVELFDAGVGCKPAAEALSVPRETVREWQWVYRAFGSEALLSMDGKQSSYTFEQRVAAASAVVDDGMAKADAMAEFGIRSKSPLERWCRLYREGGAEALRPGPKGRPRGSRSKPRARTREQELEERCRRLEAEVAYLKNCAPWSSGTGSDQGGGRGGEGAASGGALPAPPAGVLGAQEVDLLLRAGAPAEADPARAARRRGRDILAHRQRLRAPADSHVPARRAGRGRGRQDRAQDDARDGHPVRDTPPGLPPPVQLLQGLVGSTFENVIARDFGAEGPWQKLGTDVTEFKVAGAKAYWAPVLDFCTKEIVASDISTSPDLAQQHRMLDRLLEALPDGAAPTMHSDMGWQYQHESYTSRLEGAGITQSMSRKGNCIDNAATEQLFGHVKDEFYRGREWGSFGDFKRDLEGYIAHWNTRRRQVRLKGLTPEEFRSRALAA